MFKEIIKSTFGDKALNFALFYQIENSLRFELEQSGTCIYRFTTAYNRARAITKVAFKDTEELIFILSYTAYDPTQFDEAALKRLETCYIDLPKDHEFWSEEVDEEDPKYRVFIAFKASKEILTEVLWGIFATELGIEPSLGIRVYIAAPDSGVLANPYDSRGMDVIGSNRTLLKSLYTEFNEYLLDYDRDVMDKSFT